MKPSQFSYALLVSFLVCLFGLQWYQHASYPLEIWLFLGVYTFFGLIGLADRKTRRIAAPMLAGALGIGLAFFAVARTTHVPDPSTVDYYANGEAVALIGSIVDEPDRRPLQTKYTIGVRGIQINATGGVLPVGGRVLATDRRGWPQYSYGDDVRVRGQLERPEPIETFHYDRYLSRFDVYSVIYRASFDKKGEGRGNMFFGYLFKLKETFEGQINRLLPEPHASFMAGLLTGSRKGIPEHLMEDFNITGLTHIIAISGYNITIVIAIIAGLLFWLPLKKRFFPAVFAIIAFTLFVGASAAVVRASIMGILGLIALQTGRQSDVRLTVLWTLLIMLLWNPKYLWYDAGFQLSFLAVIGLVECGPILNKLFGRLPNVLGVREAFFMTISAQIVAVPLIILLFGRISLMAPFANVLVAPLIPLAMLFGFVGTLVSFVSFPLGQIISYPGWSSLDWIVSIAKFFAEIPAASLDMKMSTWVIVGYYVILAAILFWVQRKKWV